MEIGEKHAQLLMEITAQTDELIHLGRYLHMTEIAVMVKARVASLKLEGVLAKGKLFATSKNLCEKSFGK